MSVLSLKLSQFYSNKATTLHHWASHRTPCCPTTGIIVITDYCDVTSPYVLQNQLVEYVAQASITARFEPQ